jgi:hypothetical protein
MYEYFFSFPAYNKKSRSHMRSRSKGLWPISSWTLSTAWNVFRQFALPSSSGDQLSLHYWQNFVNLYFNIRSSGQSSWLQIRRPGFDSRHYQIFWRKKKQKKTVVGLERGPLSLVSTTEELLDRKVAAPV